MAVRSVDFLPEIFQTDANKQFLSATLDTLVQEPRVKRTQGFIGRTVGPGVNPNDRYVVEPDKTRANYQLEPGVVALEPDTTTIQNAITYPGINDAIGFQGGIQSRPDRLYQSEYYTWDPFVDFDKFINFSQYFWVPDGPPAVTVAATKIPSTGNYVITRENGVYTFSGVSGTNPTLELLRNGNYTFQVAQNDKETVNYRVRNDGTAAYVIDFENNPTLTLARGNTYVFQITLSGDYPFWIKTAPTLGTDNAYNDGVSRNGSITGNVTFVVPQDAPDTLYYTSQNQTNLRGVFNIVNGESGSGPGFWIQTNPGVSGRVPTTPNISSRDVLGVENNGEDLGTITFNVPSKTAQQYYYNLTNFGTVDLLTELDFDQINNQPVDIFNSTYGGIDGITSLNGRTLVFNTSAETATGGWYRNTLFDPLIQDPANNGLIGSYDSLPYDQTTEIPVSERFQVWQITYVNTSGTNYLQLNKITDIPIENKFTILYGAEWSNTGWYKNLDGTLLPIPLLSAIQDTLYYQDGGDPEIFGRIRLVDLAQDTTIFVEEILGKVNYTSPNGVVFTNGLKVRFEGDVEPAAYFNNEYYVAGVGTSIELLPVENFVCPETYVEDAVDSTIATEPNQLDYLTINQASKDLNAWTRSNRWFHIDVINAAATYNNTVAVLDNAYRAKRPIIEFRPGIRLWNMGTSGKAPVDVIDFSETDAFSNIEGSPSYSYAGYDFVQGTRVIFALDEDIDVRDKIWTVNFIEPESVIVTTAGDFTIGYHYRILNLGTTDWNIVAGTTGVTYAVGDEFVVVNVGTGTGIAQFIEPVIHLTLADDGLVETDQNTVVLNIGTELFPIPENQAGKTYWYDGSTWTLAQQKNGVQQAPLFNVYDPQEVSFGDQTKYPSSTFAGSKLFSYAVGDTTILDPVLQFPLQYLNINNVGDIVFENNLYKDTFLYVQDNVSVTLDISSGSARDYSSRTEYQRLIGWQTATTTSQIRQQFKFTYTNSVLKLDVRVNDEGAVPPIKLYVGAVFQDPSLYTYTRTVDSTTITLLRTYVPGDIIEVAALSDQTSRVAFYQVPINLSNNPLNSNSQSFTLGTIRTHYESICENLVTLQGPVNGANNTRDLGNIGVYGLIILQQSAPLTMAGYFLRSETYNIFGALDFNSREYQKYKNQILDDVTKQILNFQGAPEILDTAIENVTAGRLETQPFYWSDMLPQGAVYTTTTYTVSFITTNTFDTVQVHNYRSANYLGMNVYLNDVLLTRGRDYTVATDGPRITIITTLNIGDVLIIREYTSTYGSFCPNTPTKLGLYPAWVPERITVRGTDNLVSGIRGHDGSFTPLFGDIRDDVLLEFETRIYNNLKLDGNPVPLTITDVLPGQFRDTGYTYAEITNILATDFLSYVAWNKLDYRTQVYEPNNKFSWNYSTAQNKINGDNLLGAWRGINRYFYDTIDPEITPWEMLGFTIKPDWWDDTYGVVPYTGDNLVLWDDLEAGYVADPIAPYYLPQYARPGLTQVIPTGSEGALLSPFDSVVGTYNSGQFQKSWIVGDGGPTEASWWQSSAYPFAVMRALAVTRPAKFFSLFADRDLYRYNAEFEQYLYEDRYRLNANGIEVYGNGVSKASFINWIVDYNRLTGLDSTADIQAGLQNLDVRLCYRMASFSDKQYIKIYTEKSSPNSTNTALLIPDESYDLLLYKNQPFDRSSFSGVVVQQVAGGWAVFGYGTTQPYFNILVSQPNGVPQTIAAGGSQVQVATAWTDNVAQIPYGFVFGNRTAVVDFLLSYGKFLSRQGFVFDNITNGYILTWEQMAQEFLYWSNQGWEENALINLNPLAFRLQVTAAQSVIDSVRTQFGDNVILDQNRRELPTRNLNIVRIDNTFTIEPLSDQTVSYIDLRYTSFEHMIVMQNQSVFGDLIYDPVTGARQSRLNLVAVNTANWNGTPATPGFILNQDNVEEWTGLRTYSKGEIVRYKNVYWSALTIVQPSTNFNFNDWTQSDYTQIELGLLPNLASKADQLATSYDTNSANVEQDTDLLSYGLIGFRPRQYMAALNLSDISQVNVYQQFLGSKGTILSAELFKSANLGKEAAQYDVYENWAVQRAVYGANANRSWIELRLDRALLDANPSLVQIVLPQQASDADQPILLTDIWSSSYKLSSPDVFPVTTELPTDIGLPTAGYVKLDDADITVFDIADPTSLSANINDINVGTTIWVAKINTYDWNIYRASQVDQTITHVCDNLDGTSRVIFSGQHSLTVGQKLIIRLFDPEINGVYDVLAVVDIYTVNIAFQFTGDRTVANGQGAGFTLQTMRVSQASDILDLPYANTLASGARVWVDDNGDGLWETLEKQDVFSDLVTLSPILLDAQEQYGQSVAQARNRLAYLIGSPNYGFGTGISKGAVYLYVRDSAGSGNPISPLENEDAILTLDGTGVRGYGNAVDFGDQTWAVAGASASLGPAGQANNGYVAVIYRDPALGQPGVIPYAQWQLLTQDNGSGSILVGAGEFGYSVTMSADERWMYIGAPGLSSVHAYGRVDWQNQFVKQFGDNSTMIYAISDVIQIDNDTQLKVTLDGQPQTLNVDYTVDPGFGFVTFVTPPAADVVVNIERLNIKQLDAETYFEVPPTSTSGSGIGAEFTIVRVRGEVGQPGATQGTVGATSLGSGYNPGDTITIAATSFGGGSVPANNIVLTVTSVGAGGALGLFNIAYTPPSLATTFTMNDYFFTATNIYSFSIKVNDALYRPNIDYTFNPSTSVLTFTTVPAAGDIILATAQGYFQYVDTLQVPALNAGNRLGSSVATTTDGRQILIGAPNVTVDGLTEAGSVYVFDRNVQKFIYGSDPSSVSFTLLGTPVAPISVLVNGVFLINEQDATVDAPNSFYWDGSNTVTVNTDLQIGDIVEIETNQFVLTQTINQDQVEEFCNFGTAVDICSYNCSLYAGAPQSSIQVYKGGVVERNVNVARVYGTTTATIANPTLTAGHTLRINNIDVAVPVADPTVSGLATEIAAQVPNVSASVTGSGLLVISVKTASAAAPGNKLQVAPGSVGTAYADLGFEMFAWTQTILSPYPISQAAFGQSISIDDTALNLVVGAPNGNLYIFMIFDDGTTFFDAKATEFYDETPQSGVVYVYNYLNSANESINNPGKFVFGEQMGDIDVLSQEQFGTAVSYSSGLLMIGSPGADIADSSTSNYGSVYVYDNPNRTPSWVVTVEQQPTVDVRLLNGSFLYDRITSAKTAFLDFFNPLQGKILGAARQNIDYISGIDPASYNIGPTNIRGTTWGEFNVGKTWWNISTVRFIDPNQDDIVYASRRWGQIFPGSTVEVYQWIVSPVPPVAYTGEGTVYSVDSYVINSRLNDSGLFSTEYYFWVRGITSVAYNAGKTLSVNTVASYISNPRGSGIAYLAPINSSTIAIYNCGDLIEASDTIINVEYDRQLTNDNVHVEYELITQDRSDGFLSDNLYRKLQDSFCGVDTAGNLVPDPNLPIAQRYGVQFRPRQSMFVDRFLALENYLVRVNAVLAQYPISENRSFNLLDSSEPIPGANSGLWDVQVPNLEILQYSFEGPGGDTLGLKYLVINDSNNRGLWTIYTVETELLTGDPTLVLTRVQLYYTPDYWSYINWYLPGYNPSTKVVAEVANFSALGTLSVPVGSSVKVTANAQGKFEIYLLTDLGWTRVGLQDGTISFDADLYDYALGRFGYDVEVFDAQYFDQEPVTETRKVIQAINQELLVDDLAIERNRSLVLMFNFVLSEFSAPEWLVKTSLVDVDHRIRELVPYQNYIRDNQEFVEEYIQEVKPYHVQIREFNLLYTGYDQAMEDLTDFDVPAYYDTSLEIPTFISPILLPYAHATNQIFNTLSDTAASANIWQTWPYSQWFTNYLLYLDSITVVEQGSGYSEPPEVTITGDAIEPATAVAITNSLGRVVAVNVISPGSGYRSTPTITFEGGNGSGARAYPIMQNDLVRSFKTTIKYDRFQYRTRVETWSPNVTYQYGTLARFNDVVWQATQIVDAGSFVVGRVYRITTVGNTNWTAIGATASTVGTAFIATGTGSGTGKASTANNSATFDLENWTEVPASDLAGIDRTMGYYVAGVNEPGLDLPLLIDGIDYPGVQVWGQYFNGTQIVDADYQSEFTDTDLGNRFTDINVDGGEFIGPYEGHAPEELVNGSEFDTVDIRVYTRPGSDWTYNGHGFQIAAARYTFDPSVETQYSWAGLVDHPVEILVINQTTERDLYKDIDYTVDWDDQTVSFINNVTVGDIVGITAYELGGGSQLYRANYIGADVGNEVVIPVNAAEITSIALFVNGQATVPASYTAYIESETWNILNTYERLAVVSNAGIYYRAIQAVPAGIAITDVSYWYQFVPTLESLVTFPATYGPGDGIALVAFGVNVVDAGRFIIGRTYTIQTLGTTNWVSIGAASNTAGISFVATGVGSGTGTATTNYGWSTPQVQNFVVDAGTVGTKTFPLTNSLQGTNVANMVVEVNGLRLRPPEGIEWIGDDSSVEFGLPQRGGYSQAIINAPTDVMVWVDGILQVQSVGAVVGTYSVTNWTGSNTPGRQVQFVTPPQAGARILISVDTVAEYNMAGANLEIASALNLGDIVSVTTWNDTSQQDLLTLVFQGPVITGLTVNEPYDSTAYDAAIISYTPGAYDYTVGTSIPDNDLWLERSGVEANRLWVTLNGYRLSDGSDYTVQGEYLVLASGPMASSDILAVTELTQNVVPEAMAFRIFQDMRGVQGTYRITENSSTVLTQPMTVTDDIIYVDDASRLSEPNLPIGVFGVVMIDGERILYRNRDTALNTLSGLQRGTAGTAISAHETDATVTDMGRGNILLEQYQDYVVSDTSIGDASTTVFYAPSIDITDLGDSSTVFTESIEVYVGGTRVYNYAQTAAPTSQYRYIVSDFGPLAIEFIVDPLTLPPLEPPEAGVEVTILQRRGTSWYQPGIGTASDGAPLQETDTPQARFLKGL